jgi:hypothetical protein
LRAKNELLLTSDGKRPGVGAKLEKANEAIPRPSRACPHRLRELPASFKPKGVRRETLRNFCAVKGKEGLSAQQASRYVQATKEAL